MSPPVLRLKSLAINGFRGIRLDTKPVTIDFSSRLTVLLAPNGTGKSSICQAAQWALTGCVEGFENDEGLAWRGAQRRQATSGAAVSIGDHDWSLVRNLNGWRARGPDGEDLTQPKDILGLLAPGVVLQDQGRRARTGRESWLLGTHFLDGANLSLLLDEKNQEARRRVFADLFGTQELDESETRLGQYAKGFRQELHRARQDLTKAEEALAALPPEEDAGDPSAVRDALYKALRLLKEPTPSEELSTDRLLEHVAMVREEADAAWAEAADALAALDRLDHPFEDMLQERDDRYEMRRRIDGRLTDLRNRLEALATADREEEAALNNLWPTIEALWGKLASFGTATGAVMVRRYPASAEEETLSEETRRLDQIEGLLQSWEGARARLNRAQGELNQRQTGDLTVDELSEALENAGARVATLDEHASTTQQAEVLMRQAAEATLQARGDAAPGDCPLCGHDWENGQALSAAILQTLEKMPDASRHLADEKAKAEQEVRNLRVRLQEARRVQDLQAEASDVATFLEETGARLDDQLKPKEAGAWRAALEAGRADVATARVVRNFLTSLREAEGVLRLSNREALSLMVRYRDVQDGVAEARRAALGRAEKEQAEQSRLERQIERLDQARAWVSKRLETLETQLEPAEARWGQLTLEPFSRGLLREIAGQVKAKEAQLLQAGKLLEAARKVVAASAAASLRRERQAELKQAARFVERLEEKHDLAQAALEKITRHRNGFIRRQMDALMPRIDSLFGRVHANRVFSRLVVDDDDPLQWYGEFQNERLSPKDFSQGQRQDLALAIFLARACTLKGTFFLDEPLVHLDDLNRVAMLDILRMIALTQPDVHLVLTTANRPLARHIKEKFGLVERGLAQVLRLEGSPRGGLTVHQV